MVGRRVARLIAAALLFAGAAHAGWVGSGDPWTDLAEPVFINHQTEGGLPRATVTALAQDREGFLWVGTQNGLVRWDGYRAKLYQQNHDDPRSLPDNYVLSLHLDAGGRLWVATSAGGLARFDPTGDNFTPIETGPSGISSQAVSAVEDDGEGGLWVGTDVALDHIGADGKAFEHLHPGEGTERIRALLKDGSGRLWIGTERGLYRRGGSAAARIGGIDTAVYSLAQDSQGRIWAGTRKKGVMLVAAGADTAILLPVLPANEWVVSMVESRTGEMWLATYGEGVIVVDRAAASARRFRHDAARPNSLADDTIWAMLRDRSGLIWIGGNGGLTHTDPNQSGLLNIFGGSGKNAALSDNEVWASRTVSDGKTWVGLARNGIDILDARGRPAGNFRPDPQRPNAALPDTPVISLAETEGGAVWIGTYIGLYRTDLSARALRRVPLSAGKDRPAVSTLYNDGKTLWLGSHQGGLWRLDPRDERILFYEAGDHLTDGRVQTLAPAPDGKLWVGTRNGLNLLDPQTGAVLKIPADPRDPKGLAGGFVTSMLTDHQGRLWVATFGGGINVLTGYDDGGRPRFRNLGYAQGLPNTNVDQMLMDRDGRVWAGTDDGVAVIDPDSFAIRPLRTAQGAVLSVCTTGSAGLMADGSLLFGSLGGMLVIRPDQLPLPSSSAPVVITDILAGGHSVTGKDLVIEPDRNSLTVEFAALDYVDPARTRFAYRLEGFDRDWTETDATRRLAAYTNLPPGKFVLRIKAIGSDQGNAVDVRVLPAWYQSWVARILFALLAVAGVGLLVRVRTAHLRRRERELQALVDQRTADLRETNRRLEVLSTTDRLTGAYNRLFLDTTLANEFARSRRSNRPFSIVLIDMDKFKSVNDEHGHLVGDKVLVHLVDLLRAHKRKTDILGRWGGEEFLIVCPETPAAGVAEMAEALRRAVEEAAFPEVGRKTISVGVATLGGNESIEDMVSRADAALYAAKNGGRNRVVVAA